jgi:hypothetical protein
VLTTGKCINKLTRFYGIVKRSRNEQENDVDEYQGFHEADKSEHLDLAKLE